jgi:ubiquinone/menaquinone biosynthesis C-methylase UbiE
MKQIHELTVADIAAMNYNELIGLTRETNRTPGGLNTIKTVSRSLLLNSNSKIMDIGASTGHTTIEFSRLLNCEVVGIDINEMSLAIAKERCDNLKLEKARFMQVDAVNMPFHENSFDLVFAGNVTSLIDDRRKALSEYWRVLKPNGYLVAVPMYYIQTPSDKLLDDVRAAIRVNITAHYKHDWINFFRTNDVELYEEYNYKFTKCSDDEIDNFCKSILERQHLDNLNSAAKELLEKRYIEYMHLFNINLSHMGYSILILRRKENEKYNDLQLYFSEQI